MQLLQKYEMHSLLVYITNKLSYFLCEMCEGLD
jgi:hypothetical protein